MIQNRWDQSLSPGNEQSFYWGSQAADIPGTRNYMGAKDPAIDAMIAALLEARERPAFVSAVRALDRALMSGFYAIPLFNVGEQWIARWNRIERPATTALTGYLPETWWQKTGPQPNDYQVITSDRPSAVTQPTASPTLDTTVSDGSWHGSRMRWRWSIPLNKPRMTGQPPKRLTFAQADRMISSLAAHFIESGLPANSVIAVQLPNTVEFALTVLAAYRAGLVVAVLPLLWRQAELTMALNRTAARAIVTTSKVDGVIYSDLAMNAAAEAFSIRHVCGFGTDLPEGMASLDNAIFRESTTARAVIQDGRKAALISFDVTSDGFRPVPRAHLSLIAGGLAMSLESDVPQGATVLSAFAPMSFAGLASSLVVWLLSGGTLVLHHPFDEEVLEQQINEHACDTLIAPAQLALRLDELDLAARLPSLRNVIGLWRAPEQVASSACWAAQQATLTDVYLFGEAGLFGARRIAEDGSPALIKPGPHGAPRELPGIVDRRRNPADAAGHAGIARTDGAGRRLRAAAAAERLADRAAAARLRRYRLCGAARPLDRRDQHHRAAVRDHGRRRLPLPGAGPAGMGPAARPGRAADGAARPPQRPPARRPRPRQCPRPRRAGRTRP